jgi:hypothetical protein
MEMKQAWHCTMYLWGTDDLRNVPKKRRIIKLRLKQMGFEGIVLIELAQDTIQWWFL